MLDDDVVLFVGGNGGGSMSFGGCGIVEFRIVGIESCSSGSTMEAILGSCD